MLVNLSQYRGSVGIFKNKNFSVPSKVSHFTYLSDNNNKNLAIGSLMLLNKIGLVLLLLTLMFVFKGNASKHKTIAFNGNTSKLIPLIPLKNHLPLSLTFHIRLMQLASLALYLFDNTQWGC